MEDCSVSKAIYIAATALVVLTIAIIYYVGWASKRERMEPYVSWLSYDIFRSDPQFDRLRDHRPADPAYTGLP